MARRRRRTTIFEDAIRQPWQFSAGVAIFSLLTAYFLLPLLSTKSGFLAPLTEAFVPIFNWATLLFGIIALLKLATTFRQPAAEEPLRHASSTRHRHHTSARTHERPPQAPPPGSPLPAAISQLEKPSVWSLEVLQYVEWKLFEDLCAAYYREKGLRCDTTPLGPDGGIDIRIYQNAADPARTTAIVQCKAMRIVGIKPMRELLGVMAHEKLEKGFFMTSGEFTEDSKAFGQQNRVVPIDGKLLLSLMERLPADAQQRLLEVATRGDWTTPSCPDCGQKMGRKDPPGKRPFWACKRGRCKGRLDMRYERF